MRAFAANTPALQEILKKVHQTELRYQMNIWIEKEMSARNVKKRVNIKILFLNCNYLKKIIDPQIKNSSNIFGVR